jgi:hypothetical protein
MSSNEDLVSLGRRFHGALVARDWPALDVLLTRDATWTLPGRNRISGRARGAAAVLERAKLIAGYGINFQLDHILVSATNMALSLHNTAARGDLRLDEHLATVCQVKGGYIEGIETFLSDVEGMNRFFV